jgi:hypothetical protein
VERTIEFEKLLSDRFSLRMGLNSSNGFDDDEILYTSGTSEEASAGGGRVDMEAIKKRWLIDQLHKEIEQKQRQLLQLQKQEEEALQATGETLPTNFKGIISSCFDPIWICTLIKKTET